jgi:hypothetical protein
MLDPAHLGDLGVNPLKEFPPRDPLKLGIVIGEVITDIAQRASPEYGVDYRVSQDVAVGVTGQALVRGQFHTSDHQFAALNEPVDVITHPDLEHRLPPS